MSGQEQDASCLSMVVLAFLLGVVVTGGLGVVANVFHVGQSWDPENRACVAAQEPASDEGVSR